MFFYTKANGAMDNWNGPWLCGYVFEAIVHQDTGPGKNPGGGFGGYVEIVDLFSKTRDDMHFYGPKGNPEVVDLSNSGYYNKPAHAFYAPVAAGPNVIGMYRFWDKVNNYNLFTTLQNDPLANGDAVGRDYSTIGYESKGISFYIFKPEFGPQQGLVPLYRYQHGIG